jgi:hypothetical protein
VLTSGNSFQILPEKPFSLLLQCKDVGTDLFRRAQRLRLAEVPGKADLVAGLDALGRVPRIRGVGQHFTPEESGPLLTSGNCYTHGSEGPLTPSTWHFLLHRTIVKSWFSLFIKLTDTSAHCRINDAAILDRRHKKDRPLSLAGFR